MSAGPSAIAVGVFEYAPGTGSWWWSDDMYALHGFRRGEVVPTTGLVTSHLHPDSRDEVLTALHASAPADRPFAVHTRLVDVAGNQHWVLLTGEAHPGRDGSGPVVRGYAIDLTRRHAELSAAQVSEDLSRATAARSVIDQAKGVLTLAYGLGEDAAFDLLRWYSRNTNTKLRTLAEQLVGAAIGDLPVRADLKRHLDDVFDTSDGGTARTRREARGHGPTDEEAGLRCRHERLDGALVLRVEGDVDLATGPRFASALAAAEKAALADGCPVLVVDLTTAAHVAPVGVSTLLSSSRRCTASRVTLVVAADRTTAPALDATTGLAVHADVDSALARSV